jgi:cytochrome c5
MKNSKIYFFIAVSLLLFFSACSKIDTPGSSSLYVPTSTNVTANATLPELQNGRALYVNNCGACHGLYPPENYSVAQWKSIVPRMAQNTNLTTPELNLVIKYVCKGKQ